MRGHGRVTAESALLLYLVFKISEACLGCCSLNPALQTCKPEGRLSLFDFEHPECSTGFEPLRLGESTGFYFSCGSIVAENETIRFFSYFLPLFLGLDLKNLEK